jgi:hypothetical protein
MVQSLTAVWAKKISVDYKEKSFDKPVVQSRREGSSSFSSKALDNFPRIESWRLQVLET